MRNVVLVTLAATIAFTSSGCAAMWNISDGNSCIGGGQKRVYGGIQLHVERWSRTGSEELASNILYWGLFLWLDLPLCLVFDTLTLPCMIAAESSRRGLRAPEPR